MSKKKKENFPAHEIQNVPGSESESKGSGDVSVCISETEKEMLQ